LYPLLELTWWSYLQIQMFYLNLHFLMIHFLPRSLHFWWSICTRCSTSGSTWSVYPLKIHLDLHFWFNLYLDVPLWNPVLLMIHLYPDLDHLLYLDPVLPDEIYLVPDVPLEPCTSWWPFLYPFLISVPLLDLFVPCSYLTTWI
jgi:hypothetical protein